MTWQPENEISKCVRVIQQTRVFIRPTAVSKYEAVLGKIEPPWPAKSKHNHTGTHTTAY
jgi:hypothetical protein